MRWSSLSRLAAASKKKEVHASAMKEIIEFRLYFHHKVRISSQNISLIIPEKHIVVQLCLLSLSYVAMYVLFTTVIFTGVRITLRECT